MIEKDYNISEQQEDFNYTLTPSDSAASLSGLSVNTTKVFEKALAKRIDTGSIESYSNNIKYTGEYNIRGWSVISDAPFSYEDEIMVRLGESESLPKTSLKVYLISNTYITIKNTGTGKEYILYRNCYKDYAYKWDYQDDSKFCLNSLWPGTTTESPLKKTGRQRLVCDPENNIIPSEYYAFSSINQFTITTQNSSTSTYDIYLSSLNLTDLYYLTSDKYDKYDKDDKKPCKFAKIVGTLTLDKTNFENI